MLRKPGKLMLPDRYKEVLKLIAAKLESKNIPWCLIGSANLAMQGIGVMPQNIDILASIIDIKAFQYAFPSYISQPMTKKFSSSGVPIHELNMKVNGLTVIIHGQYANDLHYSKFTPQTAKTVLLDGVKIQGLPLDAEAEIYGQLGRDYKKRVIVEFLRRNGTKQ
jgi:hypothetical protein